ncbi:MAG: multicopper oxidase domain-containing protein [Geothrix sp.]|uniref:multicopper oxidase family protein n=1 Tax=Geothrix sp. TaxID=1962974 RepID=UPI00180645DC|nr:multicopper oxidase domain-containing protein [Geothrix sp.]NWJ42243.1 multicopper oxidase domain-containing protein [Geothrix sp.]WIL19790.1 MAG: multicopper oxidase domain-containing protein [Geothrix sp.]
MTARSRMAYLGLFGSACAVLLLEGCGGSKTTAPAVATPAGPAPIYNPLNPELLQQFANAFVEIPIAPKDVTTPTKYTVNVRQGSWDFGLRDRNGNALKDPYTGKPIATKTWGYDINGAFLGIYGATVEATNGTPLTFNYINNLRDEVGGAMGTGPYLTRHLLQLDYTLDGTDMGEPECRITTHLHGGDVPYTSDGHPDAWVTNDPAVQAKWVKAADPSVGFPGRPSGNALAPFTYPNSQGAATLWFHDHSMGITRLNAYAGVAAFYIIKDPVVEGAGALANLPKGRYANPVVPSLQSDEFDLPVVIQDKAFTEDGSIVFPAFVNLGVYTYNALHDSSGNALASIRPEMWGNVITVNGKAWPYKSVKTQLYRFRFVNGSDSRMYNLWLQDADTGEIITPALAAAAAPTLTWPVVQIAAEQGYRDAAIDVATGPGNDGLLLANGARVDLLVDFGHPVFKGRNIVLRNDCPAPFGGDFSQGAVDFTTLDPKTTGRVMLFKVASTTGTPSPLLAPAGPATSLRTGLVPFVGISSESLTRQAPRLVDMQERKDPVNSFLDPTSGLVTFRTILVLNNKMFRAPISEKPELNSTEEWVFINATPDVHPMHIHLTKFQVVEKGYVNTAKFTYTPADGFALPTVSDPSAFVPNAEPPDPDPPESAPEGSLYRVADNEKNVWKDTVMVPPAGVPLESGQPVQYPGYVRVRLKFDQLGAYMWHCHILSHEENEMMRSFLVVPVGNGN